ncbi:hypothetical protein ALO_04783, partial [Acetonema longum DSM 6540]
MVHCKMNLTKKNLERVQKKCDKHPDFCVVIWRKHLFSNTVKGIGSPKHKIDYPHEFPVGGKRRWLVAAREIYLRQRVSYAGNLAEVFLQWTDQMPDRYGGWIMGIIIVVDRNETIPTKTGHSAGFSFYHRDYATKGGDPPCKL